MKSIIFVLIFGISAHVVADELLPTDHIRVVQAPEPTKVFEPEPLASTRRADAFWRWTAVVIVALAGGVADGITSDYSVGRKEWTSRTLDSKRRSWTTKYIPTRNGGTIYRTGPYGASITEWRKK